MRAALDLLEERDYEQVQMRDIAARADVALGTLYRYFSSKEHLYAGVMLVWISSFRRGLGRGDLPVEPADRLRESLRRAIDAFSRRPQFLRLEVLLMSSTDAQAQELFVEFSDQHIAAYRQLLSGLADGDIDQIVWVTSAVLGNMLHSYALGRVSLEQVQEVVLGTVDLIFSPPPRAAAGGLGPP